MMCSIDGPNPMKDVPVKDVKTVKDMKVHIGHLA